jgi:FG-GAP-like repeat/ASPIC and UnbV
MIVINILTKASTAIILVTLIFIPQMAEQNSEKDRAIRLGNIVLENATSSVDILRLSPTFGAAVYDANEDGWPDLLISNHGRPPAIFLNLMGRRFQSVEQELLLLGGSDRHAPELADYDNDGDQDLYFLHGAKQGTGIGPNEFYKNPGHGKPFRRIRNKLIEDPLGRGRVGIWFDYNADGFIDLLVVNNFRQGVPNRLFRNQGNGSFTDVTRTSGLGVEMGSEGSAIAGDIDNDGDMDVFLTNQTDRSLLFINEGDGTFREDGPARGIPAIPATRSTSMADYDGDGDLDLYLGEGSDPVFDGVFMSPNKLGFIQSVDALDKTDFLTFSADPGAVLSFEFSQNEVDLNHVYVGAAGFSPQDKDFKVGPGFFSAEGRPSQWRENGNQKGTFLWHDAGTGLWTIAAASGGEEFLSGAVVTTESRLSDLESPTMEVVATPDYRNYLLQNQGNGKFVDVTLQTATQDISNGRSCSWTDLDNDGDLDLFIVNAGFNGKAKQPNLLLRNEGSSFTKFVVPVDSLEKWGRGDGALTADFDRDGRIDLFIVNGSGLLPSNRGPYQLFFNRTRNHNHWINFQLVGGGKGLTNRDAVGAKVKIQSAGSTLKTQWQYISGGSGSNCQSSRILHFGLGNSTRVIATIYWPPSKQFPSGHSQRLAFGSSDLDRIYLVGETFVGADGTEKK